MPLLVRRPACGRGREIVHPSGRILVPTDSSPAHYLLSLSMARRRPSLQKLRDALERGRMPVANTLTASELRRARYTGLLSQMGAPNLDTLGYSVCHVSRIGLQRTPLELRTETELVAHSLLFLSPVNMFVVPKPFAGVGELPEFIEEMDDARCFAAAN